MCIRDRIYIAPYLARTRLQNIDNVLQEHRCRLWNSTHDREIAQQPFTSVVILHRNRRLFVHLQSRANDFLRVVRSLGELSEALLRWIQRRHNNRLLSRLFASDVGDIKRLPALPALSPSAALFHQNILAKRQIQHLRHFHHRAQRLRLRHRPSDHRPSSR